MRDDWQSMLINAALMSVAGVALIVGALVLIWKALCHVAKTGRSITK